MLQITARLFKDGQLVGYRLTDGNQTQDLTKIQTWMYAKNKQIINVTAAGTQDDPQLSGTNGFKLKELPEIKFGQPAVYSEMKNNRCKYSNSLVITNYIVDCKNPERVIMRTKGPIPKSGDRGLIGAPLTIGYMIKNIGNEPIQIERIAVNSKETETAVLSPGQSLALSRKEVVALGFKLEVDGIFANAKLVSSKKVERTLENEKYFYIKLTDENTDITADDFRLDIWKVAKPDEISKYFDYIVSLDSKQIEHSNNISAALRYLINNTEEQIKNNRHIFDHHKWGEFHQNDVKHAIITEENRSKYSNALEIVAKITDDNLGDLHARIDGYAVRNRGNEPINITRIVYDTFEKSHVITLNPGETAYLSRVETAVLASRPEFNGIFYNGKVRFGLSGNPRDIMKTFLKDGKYKWLMRYCSIANRTYYTGFGEICTWDCVEYNDLVKFFGSRVRSNRQAIRTRQELHEKFGEYGLHNVDIDLSQSSRVENINKQQAQQSKGFFGSVVDTFNRFKR